MAFEQTIGGGFIGEVWCQTEDCVAGWVVDASAPHNRLNLSLWQGRNVLSQVRANLFMDVLPSDSVAANLDMDVRAHGFEIPLSAEAVQDGTLELEVGGRRYPIPAKGGRPLQIRTEVADPAPVASPVHTIPTAQAEPLQVVPSASEPSATALAEIAANEPAETEKAKPLQGRVDECFVKDGRLHITGWLHNPLRQYDNVKFDLSANAFRQTGCLARDLRMDLKRAGFGAGYHAFRLTFDVSGVDLGETLTVLASETGEVIVTKTILYEDQAAVVETASAEEAPNLPEVDLSQLTVQYRLERAQAGRVEGWARYKECPEIPVLIDLYLDGVLYTSTEASRYRPDVAKHFKDDHTYGFLFELPLNLMAPKDLRVEVRARYGVSEGNPPAKMLRTGPDAVILNPEFQMAPYIPDTAPTPGPLGKIAYIVLNLNTANLLVDLFESFERHNAHDDYEILIIDHGSTDNSKALCDAWQERLNLRFLDRAQNYSFSGSNNYGATRTDADTVVFLNNDIVFTQDMSRPILEILRDERVGMVGTKLYDPKADSPFQMPAIQHLGVLFSRDKRSDAIKPFEQRFSPQFEHVAGDLLSVPCVTGALMACRREEFLSMGGFDTGFFYGYEDVDLCLKYRLLADKEIICANSISGYHVRGYSRARADESVNLRRANNGRHLSERFGSLFRRAEMRDLFGRPAYWTGKPPVIAFAVTEATMDTSAGDYFTALELALDLQKAMTCQIVFLDKERNWFDLSGIDVLITMRDDYDLRRIQNASPNLTTIGWARNWIDRWAERPWAEDYHLIWASSETAAAHLREKMARPVEVVRIATNPERFKDGRKDSALASDYCFTGSFFGAGREIMYNLDPGRLPFDFGLFGHNWDQVVHFADHTRGPLPYTSMPDVYANTRIVLDDANSATKQWGSVNSRVFDAISAGALVLTNGEKGAREVFGDAIPVYKNQAELEAHLTHYLNDEEARRAKVAELQAILNDNHTYAHRAGQVATYLKAVLPKQLRFAIKIGAPRESVREEWGDYHYAIGLRRALTRMGHSARIDCLDRWAGDHCTGDDVVIVLRGLSEFKARPDQITLMWNISHPDKVSIAEYNTYDHVFIASEKHADRIAREVEVPVSCLLQCTDPEVFDASEVDPDLPVDGDRLLFVGNSRNIFRTIVRDSVNQDLPLDVYGSRWEQFIGPDMLKGSYLPNQGLAGYYAGAKAILNDHWDDMRERGFISNRLFDAGATGAYIITDEVQGMAELFGDAISMVRTPEELAVAAALPDTDPERVAEMRRKVREIVRQKHSFDARAAVLLEVVENRLAELRRDLEDNREVLVV